MSAHCVSLAHSIQTGEIHIFSFGTCIQSCITTGPVYRETEIGEYVYGFRGCLSYLCVTSGDQHRGLRSLTCVPIPLSGATVIMPWRVVSSANCDRPLIPTVRVENRVN